MKERVETNYDYSYSMGIDNAWSVDRNSGFGWFGGLPYNYGLEADCFTPAKPHYPVPTTIGYTELTPNGPMFWDPCDEW